jgi:hypothetical protein
VTAAELALLTPRQRQVVRIFTAMGGNKRATARELEISRPTLDDHLDAIWRRIGREPSQEERGYPDDNPAGGC